ncbi:MAG TPA: hypothetical protein VI299_16165, partial [Polyangiales bacterium]
MSRDKIWSRIATVGVLALASAALLPRPAPAQNKPPLQVAATTAAPLSLTGSDGSGLELVSLEANAVIEDPLAFT